MQTLYTPFAQYYFDAPEKPLKNSYLWVYVAHQRLPACTRSLLHYDLCTSENVLKNKYLEFFLIK